MLNVFAFLLGFLALAVLGLWYGLRAVLGWVRLFFRCAFGDYVGFRWFGLGGFWADDAGAVTINFVYPITGAGPPTAAQVALLSAVVATIQATADADTTAVITHNLALTAAQLAAGGPWVVFTMLVNYVAAAYPCWTVTSSTTNAITCTKNATVGTGNAAPQVQVTILRPNTIIQ